MRYDSNIWNRKNAEGNGVDYMCIKVLYGTIPAFGGKVR